MAKKVIHVVVLNANGEKRALTVSDVTGPSVAKALRKTKAAGLIGVISGLQLWSWSEGKAGTENKHELPPPYDTTLLFGDILVAREDGEDLTLEAWDTFYNEAFGGFEELDDDEEEADEEEEVEEEVDEEEDEEVEEEEVEAEEDDAESEVDEDDDCYDDGDEAGGGSSRRAPRKKTAQSEYRRVDMGLKGRIKLPGIVGKRAPRWQTEEELEVEEY